MKLSKKQIKVLLSIDEGVNYLNGIEKSTSFDQKEVKSIIKSLEKENLVEIINKDDQPDYMRVKITTKGKELLEEDL